MRDSSALPDGARTIVTIEITYAVLQSRVQLFYMRQLILALAVLSFATPARAQFNQPPPAEPEPPATSAAPPAPSIAAAELIQRGHQKKVIGATLIILGSVLSAGGIALVIADTLDHPGCSDCGFGKLLITGVVFDVVGTALLAAGIPTYVIGGVQMDKGQRLQGPSLALRF